MNRDTRIHVDGNSPLSSYITLLISVPESLKRLLNRDAEAVRILTATPALPEAQSRADKWFWDRQREKYNGEIVLTRRIWTRRDERLVNILRGLAQGAWPQRRAAGYIDRLQPRNGPSLHDKQFRLAIDEARQDGTAAALCPKLEESKATYDWLISAAQSVDQGNEYRSDFDSARSKLSRLAGDLLNWTKQPGTTGTMPAHQKGVSIADSNTSEGGDETKATRPAGPTSRSEERAEWLAKAMLLVRDHPDWSDAEIARRVGKDKSTLSRSKEYRAAAAMARGVKDDRHRGHISVNPSSGLRDVEAYSDGPAELDWDE
ncbi:MAG: hypothetical protein MK161_16100 [Pirellulales bacterium]|nr:hypothetical protein [Pirellulales bacterium]